MPVLILKFNKNIIKKFRLDKGMGLTIGRRETNDIVIDNLAVSGNHAKIESVGDGYLFTDLQSKNGSFVNKQLITSQYLTDGDIINIGKHILFFRYEQNETMPGKTDTGLDKTMVMDTDKYRSMLAESENGPTPGMSDSGDSGLLTYLTGGDGDVTLTKKMMKIGKAADSDIVVSGLLTGKNAATISLRPNGYYFSYVGGLSKPRVNDDVVSGSIKLKEYDIIQVGSAKMQFTLKK